MLLDLLKRTPQCLAPGRAHQPEKFAECRKILPHRPTGLREIGQPVEHENDFQFLLRQAMRTLELTWRAPSPRVG
jgi:hypothetical protein